DRSAGDGDQDSGLWRRWSDGPGGGDVGGGRGGAGVGRRVGARGEGWARSRRLCQGRDPRGGGPADRGGGSGAGLLGAGAPDPAPGRAVREVGGSSAGGRDDRSG